MPLTTQISSALQRIGTEFKTVLVLKTNTQTGTTYTFVASDQGRMITFGAASATAVTVPTNATVPFPIGTQLHIIQLGTGQVTIAGAGGVTVSSAGGLKLESQYSGAELLKINTDAWVLVGRTTV